MNWMNCPYWPAPTATTLDVGATKRAVEEAAKRFHEQFGDFPNDVRAHPETIWKLLLTLPPHDAPRVRNPVLNLLGSRIREDDTIPRGVVRMALTPEPIVPPPPPPDWHPTRSREIL